MKLAIGADISGYTLKEALAAYLREKNIPYDDYGTLTADKPVEYYDIAPVVAQKVANGEYDFGLLVCGSGMGMCQIANSFKGIRAAVCESVYATRLCRAINDSNILTLGGFLVAPHLGVQMLETFLNTKITDGLPDFHDFLLDAQVKIHQLEDKIF